MKMKTSELKDRPLDWAVGTCDQEWSDEDALLWVQDDEYQYTPTTDWAQGGPIIERERIWAVPYPDTTMMWRAQRPSGYLQTGPTPLIAAMRCYVASKLGDEIEIPEELK